MSTILTMRNHSNTRKIKINGMRVTVRDQDQSEKILPNSMWCYQNDGRWMQSTCVGDAIADHPNRNYIEILSPWFVTGSYNVDEPERG